MDEKILNGQKLLRPREIEKNYGISRKSLANWRSQGKGPKYLKLGRMVLYPQNEFENWLKRNAILVETREEL